MAYSNDVFGVIMEDIHKPTQKSEEKVTISLTPSTLWQIISVVLLVLLVASIWTGGFGLREPTGAAPAPSPSPSPSPSPDARVQVSVDDDPVVGDAKAPVTIIEFSDFQCPFCERFFTQTLPGLKSKYIDTGKVKLVYRDFPLSFHDNADEGALAAECAEDKYFEMHDKIFEGQGDWVGLPDPKSVFKGYANELGLDGWESCYDSGKYKSEISKDTADGIAAGVSGTPTFFIGNDKDGYVRLVGAQPLSAFEAAIEAELK